MSKGARNRALRRKTIDLKEVGPKIAEGLTQGATAEEALREHPVVGKQDGAALVEHMATEQETVDRLPRFRAVLRDDLNSVWADEGSGRLQRNVIASVDEETFRAIQSGYLCLRCYEPQREAFPDQCDLCGYPMAERQIMDVAMEFRGSEHVGPGMPIAEYLEQQSERLRCRQR